MCLLSIQSSLCSYPYTCNIINVPVQLRLSLYVRVQWSLSRNKGSQIEHWRQTQGIAPNTHLDPSTANKPKDDFIGCITRWSCVIYGAIACGLV